MANPVKTQIEIRGVNRVRNQLRAAASFYPGITDGITEKHAKQLAAMFRQKSYPAMLPNQKYKRTFELQRRFMAQKVKSGHWRVINRAKRKGREYALWVIKKGWQNKKYHLKRWWTIDDESAKTMPQLTKNLSIALERELAKQRD